MNFGCWSPGDCPALSSKKIVDLDELLRRADEARSSRQTLVHCHGCFDIVHPGHVRYLEFAKRQGDLLVVSLTGDSQISKGAQRPYIPQELRAENLAALEVVDLVYIDPHLTAGQLLSRLRPDIYVKGREYEQSRDPSFTAEKAIVTSYGGRVVFSSGEVVFSSSKLIESLNQDPLLEMERLSMICRRHQIDGPSCESLLSSMAEVTVLVVGDVILDRYVHCDATDLASEAAMMSLNRLEEQQYVGGAGIVARHLAGLGAKTYLLSTDADDKASRQVRDILDGDNIQTQFITCRSGLAEKTRYLVDTTKVLRVEQGEAQPLDSVAESEAVTWIGSIAGQVDAVVFCDFGYGTITKRLLDSIHKIMEPHGPITTADVSGQRGRLLHFKDVDLLCPTERELRAALHDYDRGLSNVAWNALDQTQARHLLVTLGKKGLVVFYRPTQDTNSPEWQGRLHSEYLPSLADRIIDPLGCGDAMLATATLAMAAGGNLMQSAYLGTAASALEIARLGNIPIDSGALRRWLQGRIELVHDDFKPRSRPQRIAPLPTEQVIESQTVR